MRGIRLAVADCLVRAAALLPLESLGPVQQRALGVLRSAWLWVHP